MDLRIVEICTEIWSEVSARKIVMASRKWGLESDQLEIDLRVRKHWRAAYLGVLTANYDDGESVFLNITLATFVDDDDICLIKYVTYLP